MNRSTLAVFVGIVLAALCCAFNVGATLDVSGDSFVAAAQPSNARASLLLLRGSAIAGSGLGATSSGHASVSPGTPPWDYPEILAGGQSLSVGNQAPIADAGSVYGNLALVDDAGEEAGYHDPASLSIYFEPNRVNPIRPSSPGPTFTYPFNIVGDTGLERFQDQLTVLARAAGWAGYLTVQDVTGENGTPLSGLDVGTIPFDAGCFSAAATSAVAGRLGKTSGVAGIVWTHGETDAAGHNFLYGGQLVTFRNNWEAAMALRTGQNTNPDAGGRPIRLFLTAEGSAPYSQLGQSIANQFWFAALADPRIVYVGPRYQYDSLYAGDGVHMTNYKPMMEKSAQVYFAEEQGQVWKPLWPTAFSRASNVVTLTFNVPTPPLVFDAAGKLQHTVGGDPFTPFWSNGWGFEALDQRIPGAPTAIADNGSGLVRFTWTNHGLTTGQSVMLENLFTGLSVPIYNGTWTVTRIDANTIDLQGSSYVAQVYQLLYATIYFPLTFTTTPTISGNQVTLTMNRPPVGATLEIAYAHRAGGTTLSAPRSGWRSGLGAAGALRDSETYAGISGFPNPNWAIEFNLCPVGAACADLSYTPGSPIHTN